MTDCGAEPLLPACAAADERLRGWLLAVLRRLYEDRRIEGKEWEHSFYYFFKVFLILGGFVCSFSNAPRNHFCSPAQPVATKSAAPVWVRSGGTPPPRQSGSPSCPHPPRARC